MKDVLHFAHGNGFPSPCYRQLLTHLNSQFECCYIDRIGHNPKFPVTENWPYLIEEMIDSIQTQSQKPVIAVGHSLGGVLSLMAASVQPNLFKGIIVLDSPLIGRLKSSVVRFSKAIGMISRITPASRMQERRQHWQTRTQIESYLKSKSLFKTFLPACLEDYIDYGLKKNPEGYSLRFERTIEYQIYCTIPHDLKNFEGKLQVPATLIYGKKSDVVDRLDLRYMKNQYGIKIKETEGGHMFPFEHPKSTADQIIQITEDWTK